MGKNLKDVLVEYYGKHTNKEYIVVRTSKGYVHTLKRHAGFLERRGGRMEGVRVLKVFNDRHAASEYVASLEPPRKKKGEAPGDMATAKNQRLIRLQNRINKFGHG